MKKLYIMCGVAFSGKSTLAKKIAEAKKAVLISQDELWFKKKAELNLDPDSDEDWNMVLQLSIAAVKEKLLDGLSVVFDDISLKYKDREGLRNLAKEFGVEAVVIFLNIPRNIQQERQTKNTETKERHEVPENLIAWGWEELEIPREDENTFEFKPETNIEDWLSKLP